MNVTDKILRSWWVLLSFIPMFGHPVFIAQHAVAACSRKRLEKWHDIAIGRKLTEREIIYIVGLVMEWIRRELAKDDTAPTENNLSVYWACCVCLIAIFILFVLFGIFN